jgi:hypothetical protein
MRLIILSIASFLLLQSCGVQQPRLSGVEGIFAWEVDQENPQLGESQFPAIEILPNNIIRWYGGDTTNTDERGRWEIDDGFLITSGLNSCLDINGKWDIIYNMRVDGELLYEVVLINEQFEVMFGVKKMNKK